MSVTLELLKIEDEEQFIKSHAAFIWTDRGIELHAIACANANFTFVINPWDTKLNIDCYHSN